MATISAPVVTQSSPPPLTSLTNGSAASEKLIVRNIALESLRESKSNPRKTRTPEADAELAASVAKSGVLQPVLVRALPGKDGDAGLYELVAGSRRFRAAQSVKLKTIPARILELSDEQALEVQIIENLQREDVQPIEEGRGYKALLEMRVSDRARLVKVLDAKPQPVSRQAIVEEIAKQVGKSMRYVYARMKLAELDPKVQEAVEKGKITASHADLIARVPVAHQKKALAKCFDEWSPEPLVSVRRLQTAIELEFNLDLLEEAPFKLDDAKLLPKAGACTACPKNAANDPTAESKKPVCGDPGCFAEKKNVFIRIALAAIQEETGDLKIARLSTSYASSGNQEKATPGVGPYLTRGAWVESKPGSCASTKPGLLIDGERAGHAQYYCAAITCKKHKPTDGYRHVPAARTDPKKAEAEKLSKQQEHASSRALFRACLGAVKAVDGPEFGVLLSQVVLNSELSDDFEAVVLEVTGIEKPKTALGMYGWLPKAYKESGSKWTVQQKFRLLIGLALGGAFEWNATELEKFARARKVDIKAVRAKAVAEFKAAHAPKPKPSAARAAGVKTKSTAPKAAKKKGGKR